MDILITQQVVLILGKCMYDTDEKNRTYGADIQKNGSLEIKLI